jgi:hypothetical protein
VRPTIIETPLLARSAVGGVVRCPRPGIRWRRESVENTEIAGKCFKTGQFFSDFKERSYRLVWMDYRLFYGSGEASKLSGKHFDLRTVTNVVLAFEKTTIKQRTSFLKPRKEVKNVRVIHIYYKKSILTEHRRIAIPNDVEFDTDRRAGSLRSRAQNSGRT